MLKWIFDGIGTEIISLIIGAITGGAIGYKVGVKNCIKQIQKAGADAHQKQNVSIGNITVGNGTAKINSKSKQLQKAGDQAVQTQIGVCNDRK